MSFKNDLRKKITSRLTSLSDEDRQKQSDFVCQQLLQLGVIHGAKTVCAYLSKDDELSVDRCLVEWLGYGKSIVCPKGGNDLSVAQIGDIGETVQGQFGVREPVGAPYTGIIACIIVPGRAFAKDGKRLGRGGGRYDRFLASHPDTPSIGVCFREQIVPDIPVDVWDMRVDMVIHG